MSFGSWFDGTVFFVSSFVAFACVAFLLYITYLEHPPSDKFDEYANKLFWLGVVGSVALGFAQYSTNQVISREALKNEAFVEWKLEQAKTADERYKIRMDREPPGSLLMGLQFTFHYSTYVLAFYAASLGASYTFEYKRSRAGR